MRSFSSSLRQQQPFHAQRLVQGTRIKFMVTSVCRHNLSLGRQQVRNIVNQFKFDFSTFWIKQTRYLVWFPHETIPVFHASLTKRQQRWGIFKHICFDQLGNTINFEPSKALGRSLSIRGTQQQFLVRGNQLPFLHRQVMHPNKVDATTGIKHESTDSFLDFAAAAITSEADLLDRVSSKTQASPPISAWSELSSTTCSCHNTAFM